MKLFRKFYLAAVATTLLLLASSCTEEPPSPSLIEDLRVIAIRAEPPEVLLDRTSSASSLPPVSFEALVLDPRGGPMRFDWRFCPIESDETCADFDRRRAATTTTLQAVLDEAHAQMLAGQIGAAVAAGGPSNSAANIEPFTIPLSTDLFAYHVAASGLGLGNGAWASAVLSVQSGGETLMAQKRVVLGARDLSQWNPELAGFGWQACPSPDESGAPMAAPTNCLPMRPRTANHNPEITSMQVARGALATAPFEPVTGPIAVAPGETIRLQPQLSAAGEESFQTIESSLQSNRLMVVDRSEESIVSWFTNAGTFAVDQTTRQLTKTLDNAFTVPPGSAVGAEITVFVVVRDQRGGVGWTQVDVVITGR